MPLEESFVIWLTGLPCSGKSTLAKALASALVERGILPEIIDGDALRRSLSIDLGFTRADRDANVRRIGYVARLLARNGVPVIVAAVSPYRSTREEVRSSIANFVEVFVCCPATVCEERDVKGMYALARAGKIRSFTGVDDPYEPPEKADVTLDTSQESVAECIELIVTYIVARQLLAEAQPSTQRLRLRLAERVADLERPNGAGA